MKPKELSGAIDRRCNKSGLIAYYPDAEEDDDPLACVLAVRGEKRAQDATIILNYLPEVVHDHLALSQTVVGLLKVVARQQQQIQELSTKLETAVAAKVALGAKENTQEFIRDLVNSGHRVKGAELVVEIEASAETVKAERKLEKESVEELRELAGALVSLTFGVEASGTYQKEVKRLLDESSFLAEKIHHRGNVKLKFDEIDKS
jgi:hypothetical protein